MISNGQIVGDGSWNLLVLVTDLQAERRIRVKGDLHIGGVMLRLVEELEISVDWSDHALWWPEKNTWLTKTRLTLDQCGVQADAFLHFTPMHKQLKLRLPDLRHLDVKVDFSIKVFAAVVQICKDLGIRHPEELSLCKPLEPHHLKSNYADSSKKKHENGIHKNGHSQQQIAPDTNTFIANSSPGGSTGSLEKSPFMCAPVTPVRAPNYQSTPVHTPTDHSWRNGSLNDTNGLYIHNINGSGVEQPSNNCYESFLASSPLSPEARKLLIRPKSLVEKARMNVAWLDSSLSIMEQGVQEFGCLCLKFKFFDFYDLNPKYDAVRINQIYEQARWQLLNEELDCTEDEMLMFAALQLQVGLQIDKPQPNLDNGSITSPQDDDIDAALTELETTLEGMAINNQVNDITHVPELRDELKLLRPKRFTLKGYKKYWFTCRDLRIHIHKTSMESVHRSEPAHIIHLKGCEVTPDVNISQEKYGIKLEVPGSDGLNEMYIRCDNMEQYAKWMACCKLASKGRTMADSSYELERKTILDFLQMQQPTNTAALDPNSVNINVEDYISPKYLKKLRGKLIHRIVEAHANVSNLPLVEAKMNYIKAWQNLPDHGLVLFVVKFVDSKKEELLGISHHRITKMDINSGDHLKTWRYNKMIAWNVNWKVKHMMIQFENERIVFGCVSADCKVIHEFIGGHIFLSTRSKDASQTLNEELFHKLTGGWS